MTVFKCKMCGGSIDVVNNESVAECEYCGTKQTLPTAQDENLQALFNRANQLRMKSEFDRAETLYEKIIQNKPDEPEAHWGLILCKFGIEYVEDPKTFKRIPTCHRTSFDSITADDDYKEALKYSDSIQRALYENEAKEIDRIQKEILALSSKEEPYDVFICYKETDESGQRTPDSAIANDIYHQLTNENFKVFYAAISLEDKLGSAYEPCIFAALNSSKVMLAIGTKPEYFNAVWVKNEWSRFLKMMKNDKSKLLIPCYKGMDAYDLPDEFAHLQAQDMNKIGFINDIVRGIKKVIVKDKPKPENTQTVVVNTHNNANVQSLLRRVFIFLEDGDFKSADEYCEKVLDIEPENAQAYLGKLMAELQVCKKEELKNQSNSFNSSNNYQKIMRYGDEALKSELSNYIEIINNTKYNEYLETTYQKALSIYSNNNFNIDELKKAKELFSSISFYKKTLEMIQKCDERIKTIEKRERNTSAVKDFTYTTFNNGIIITKYVGNKKNVVIPMVIQGKQVTKIDKIWEQAFDGKKGIETVDIPDTVNIISDRAFSGCFDLYQITLPKNLHTIEEFAFASTKLEKVDIPNTVTSIGDGAFSFCSNLTSVNIPNRLTNINDGVFSYCKSLISVDIPNSVTSIGNRAFSGCTNLTSISIPKSVTSIGDYAFSDCTNLTSISIPNSVTSIGNRVFSGCTNLTSINIPNGVTSIGNRAFSGCTNLTSISIPNSVTKIEKDSFFECENLQSVTILGKISHIAAYTFYKCQSLKTIHIPDTVETIDSTAFEECTHLENITGNTSVFYKSKNKCQYCGGNFTGLFTKKCSKCGHKKDY